MSVVPNDTWITGTGTDTSPPARATRHDAMHYVPDSGEQQLEAALRQRDDLVQLCSRLEQEVCALEIALSDAKHLAHYDQLTGLPNRRLLLERFDQAASLADRHRELLALLFFDVDDFKSVNDRHGHRAGDDLLRQIAARMLTSIRESDTACRYGGDEFVILLTGLNNREHAVARLQKISARLAPAYTVESSSIRLTVSNGLATYPRDAECFNDLMQLADRVMFCHKFGIRRRVGRALPSNTRTHGVRD